MSKKKKQETSKIAIFEGEEIRRVMFDGEWHFSIEDVIKALTDSNDPKQYINRMRQRDSELNEGWVQFVHTLPLKTKGGKQKVNCASTEGIFRIIQSIPSKKAEPFKRWLARVGKERIDEIEQPGKAIERGKDYYRQKGYSERWVQTRSTSIDIRHRFTDELKERGITEGRSYAILTNELYRYTYGMTASQYRDFKYLAPDDSLRDNMTNMELAATIFSEATAKEMMEKRETEGFEETRDAIQIGGKITKEAIEEIERKTGKKVVTDNNNKELDSPEVRKQIAQNKEENSEDDQGVT